MIKKVKFISKMPIQSEETLLGSRPYDLTAYIEMCKAGTIDGYITGLHLAGEESNHFELLRVHSVLHGDISILEGATQVYTTRSKYLTHGISSHAALKVQQEKTHPFYVSVEPFAYQVDSSYMLIIAKTQFNMDKLGHEIECLFTVKTPFSNYIDFSIDIDTRLELFALTAYAHSLSYTPDAVLPNPIFSYSNKVLVQDLQFPIHTQLVKSLDPNYIKGQCSNCCYLGVPATALKANISDATLRCRIGNRLEMLFTQGKGDLEALQLSIKCGTVFLFTYMEDSNEVRVLF